jgi:hypothetical protein
LTRLLAGQLALEETPLLKSQQLLPAGAMHTMTTNRSAALR